MLRKTSWLGNQPEQTWKTKRFNKRNVVETGRPLPPPPPQLPFACLSKCAAPGTPCGAGLGEVPGSEDVAAESGLRLAEPKKTPARFCPGGSFWRLWVCLPRVPFLGWLGKPKGNHNLVGYRYFDTYPYPGSEQFATGIALISQKGERLSRSNQKQTKSTKPFPGLHKTVWHAAVNKQKSGCSRQVFSGSLFQACPPFSSRILPF